MGKHFGTIEVREGSIIQQIFSATDHYIKEIPRDKITSINSGKHFPIGIFLTGVFFIALSFLLNLNHTFLDLFFNFDIKVIFIIIGGLLILISIYKSGEYISIDSPTMKISERGRGSREFHKSISFSKENVYVK